MISREDVKYVARLARLGLTEAEAEKFQKDLAAILDMIGKLKEVKIDGVEPTAQATGLKNVTRTDEAVKRSEQGRQKLLVNVPEVKDGYIKVKAVFE